MFSYQGKMRKELRTLFSALVMAIAVVASGSAQAQVSFYQGQGPILGLSSTYTAWGIDTGSGPVGNAWAFRIEDDRLPVGVRKVASLHDLHIELVACSGKMRDLPRKMPASGDHASFGIDATQQGAVTEVSLAI